MTVGFRSLCVCLALALSNAAPAHHDAMIKDAPERDPKGEDHHDAKPDRCTGIEFDAITPDEKGNIFFFKGDHLWKGLSGSAMLSNSIFKELGGNHRHVDAAFRMHQEDARVHDHIYIFLDDKVFSFYNYTIANGYPMKIQQEFPGIPSHLDAAVECPKGECITDSVLFFKGNETFSFDITTKMVKKKMWTHLPNCTSAFRWLEHYYCFHDYNFTRFHPVSGEVTGTYPKDARKYFMTCGEGFGHGGGARLRCSEVKLNAVTTDDKGRSYAFHNATYLRLDTHRDGSHYFPISRLWKEISGGVDAVFSNRDYMYIIKGGQVYIYKSEAHYTLMKGYPKPLKEELGIDGPVDAAFSCPEQHTVHVIQGQRMYEVDLVATPRVVKNERSIPFLKIDAGLCDADGVTLFIGPEYFSYKSPIILALSKIRPEPHKISPEKFVCKRNSF